MRVGLLGKRLLVFPSTDATGQCGGKKEKKRWETAELGRLLTNLLEETNKWTGDSMAF